jgi:hypothetical protein
MDRFYQIDPGFDSVAREIEEFTSPKTKLMQNGFWKVLLTFVDPSGKNRMFLLVMYLSHAQGLHLVLYP